MHGNKGQLASKDEISDIDLISQSMGRWRFLVGRRIVGRMAAKRTMPGLLDLSHLDVIDAVRRIGREGEVTVGAIAEMMRIDPSRGSRLVAELVQKGMLERAVSQADARRTVVVLTDLARSYFEEASKFKHELIADIVEGWSEEDVSQFSQLFARFLDGFEDYANNFDG